MKLCRFALIWLMTLAIGGGYAFGEERYLDFLNALREKGYDDEALLYLQQLEGKKNLPAEIRAVLPLEKALTLLHEAQKIRDANKKHAQLDSARAALEQFLQQSPAHERAALANSELGGIIVQKGRIEARESRSPSNQSRKKELQQHARDYFRQAREVFEVAVKQHKAAWEQFPKNINENSEPAKFAAWRKAELKYIQSQFNLAKLTFHESETYDRLAKDNQRLLKQAANEFEKIHTNYRSMVAGLHARMWQGKCYEEQGDLRKALGIYDELLGHGGTNEALAQLQDAVQHFRLICLNQSRKDYKIVIEEADGWIKERVNTLRNSRRRSADHLGILWEASRAREFLAEHEKTEAKEKERLLRRVLKDLQTLKTSSADYRELATEKIMLINARLNIESQDPEDFSTALGNGITMTQKISNMNKNVNAASASGDKAAIKQATDDRDAHLAEAVRILTLALELADEKTDIKELNRARYFLAIAYYYMDDRQYDAAVIGEFVAIRYRETDPTTALQSAYLSLTAYIDAYNTINSQQAKTGRAADEVDMQLVIRMAEFISKHWPQEKEAQEARMRLGEFYERLGRHEEAAGYFKQIPENTPQYLDAQLQAGQSFWNAYVIAARADVEDRVDQKQMNAWLTQARENLEAGITLKQKELPDAAAPPDNLMSAKLTLAQIYNETGEFPQAIELLATGRFPLLTHVATKGERPARGIKSQQFAAAAYQQAMRAYVGARDISKAQQALQQLEKLGSGQNVINQLVQLGRQLQEEVERLRNINDPRLPDVIASFEEFLNAMFQRKNQTIQSLFWVGQTYFDLGEGLSGGKIPAPAESAEKFSRSAEIFQEALRRGAADAQLANPKQIADMRLRLVRALRRQGKYEDAQKLVTEILTARPLAIDAQHEAAMLFSDWATAVPSEAAKRLGSAISGVTPAGTSTKVIWGWGMLSQKLLAAMLRGKESTGLIEQFAEARYRLADCRRRLALKQGPTGEQVRYLELALLDINSTVRAAIDVSNTSWWDDLNRLHAELYNDLGRPDAEPLVRPTSLADEPVVEQPADESTAPDPQEKSIADAPMTAPKSSANTKLIIAGIMTLAFVGVLGYLVLAGGKKKKRRHSR